MIIDNVIGLHSSSKKYNAKYSYKVWSRHLWEIERTKMCGRIIIIVKMKPRIAIHQTSFGGHKYATNVNKTL
jgi:hypothetical protein